MRREFHLPMAAVSREVDWATDLSEPAVPLEACLRWAEATARGELPAGWQSPPREQLESWIPHGGLVLQSGPLLKQGSLVRAPDRLALCFTIVNELSEDLSTARRRRLADVLRESSDRWRMVRVGLEGSADRPAVKAEIDLSGAPHPVLEDLFRAGLDALRLVVSWFLWPATFLADGRVACRAWEMPKAGFPARKRERR